THTLIHTHTHTHTHTSIHTYAHINMSPIIHRHIPVYQVTQTNIHREAFLKKCITLLWDPNVKNIQPSTQCYSCVIGAGSVNVLVFRLLRNCSLHKSRWW